LLGAETGDPTLSTFWRYLRVQAFVFLCGIVGPIFLVVYFAAQPDPALKWMYWAGLLITAIDVLIALALTSAANRPDDKRKSSN
jgi:phosphoglycerol transferase MdoB-like AlkP superfamily enzyme